MSLRLNSVIIFTKEIDTDFPLSYQNSSMNRYMFFAFIHSDESPFANIADGNYLSPEIFQ
jgi:hypothetical protein